MRIAIVGAGVSGLTAARLLHDAGHEVTVFEAADYAGGHTHTVDVEAGGRRHAVDTGFIVMNEVNYPLFTRLLRHLGVATQPTTMSFSVRCDETGLVYNGSSLRQIFVQKRNLLRPSFLRMLRDILRFADDALDALADLDEEITVAEWTAARRYGRSFLEHYLLPLGASLWSCAPGRFREFPMRFVVEFLAHHRMLRRSGRPQWQVVRGGSRTYVTPLTAPFADRVRLRCPVRRLRRTAEAVVVTAERDEAFDEAVVACHADEALALLADPSEAERGILSAFPYQENETVLHTDASLLPRPRRVWGAWNFHRPAGERDRATVTYHMNLLQSLDADVPLNVTLNETDAVDSSKVLGRFVYHHPLYAPGRAAAQARHAEILRVRRTSFCGAWLGYGFHEDGVRSAVRVAEAFGAGMPA